MLQGEHSAILLAFIKLPFVIKVFVLSIFWWPFYTGFTVAHINTSQYCTQNSQSSSNLHIAMAFLNAIRINHQTNMQ